MNFNSFSIGHGILVGQAVYLLGGLFLLLIGIALLFTLLYWHARALRVEAEVIGVRQAGRYFHSVYRFALPGGDMHEATSGQGSSSLKGRATGAQVTIQVMPDDPGEVREAGSASIWALTIGFLASGLWLIWFAVTAWSPTFFTWIVVAGVAIYLGSHFVRLMGSRSRASIQSRSRSQDKWVGVPIRHSEELSSSPPSVTISSKQRRTGVIFCVVGLIVIAVAFIPAQRLLQLRTGVRTTGVVTSLETNTANNSNSSFFPRVQYAGTDGTIVHFLDRTGSNPAAYKTGDHVVVLYRPGDQSSAMIDRGARNWVPVGMLLLLGATFATLGFTSLRRG